MSDASARPPASAEADRPLRGRQRLPQIVAAAAAGFAEKGYDGASLADLTAWSGLGRGALYRQIGSKAELLRSIVEQYVGAIEHAVGEIDAEADPADVLRQWAASVFAVQAELYDFARVFHNERRALDPRVADELDARLRAVGRPAIDAILRLVPEAGPDAGQAFLGMVFGSYLWFRPGQDAAALADETCRILLEGVRSRSRASSARRGPSRRSTR